MIKLNARTERKVSNQRTHPLRTYSTARKQMRKVEAAELYYGVLSGACTFKLMSQEVYY